MLFIGLQPTLAGLVFFTGKLRRLVVGIGQARGELL
jgi:hypothetical protein